MDTKDGYDIKDGRDIKDGYDMTDGYKRLIWKIDVKEVYDTKMYTM